MFESVGDERVFVSFGIFDVFVYNFPYNLER